MLTDALKQRIEDTIKKDRVILFMKGTPSMPQCGFSAAVVGLLKEAGAAFGHHNILADADMRDGLKEYANWPTFPQLWVDGQLVGGHDIVKGLAQSGELQKLLAARTATGA